LDRLIKAAEIEQKLIKKEKDRMGSRTAETVELNRLKKAYEVHKKVQKSNPVDPVLLSECEYLAHCYYLQQELIRKHSIENEALQHLKVAYYIYDSLCKREDLKLEKDELEKLVRAAEIEKRLIDLEEGRLQGDILSE